MFFADRFYGFDDACYAGARLLEILSKTDQPLSELTADLAKTYSTPELRMECPDERKFDVVAAVAEHFAKDHDVITIDGARISFEYGWGLVRASNTQALLVLRFEADTAEHLEEIEEAVGNVLLDLNGALPLRRAVEAARQSGDKLALANALTALANVERRPPLTRAAALRTYSEAAEIFRELDRPLDDAWVLRHIGIIHEYAHRLELAEEYYDRAVALYRQHSEDDLNYANAVRYPAVIKERLGKRDESLALWQEAHDRYRQCGIEDGVKEAATHIEALKKS